MQPKLLYLALTISATVCSADQRVEARDLDSFEHALYRREVDAYRMALGERAILPALRRRQDNRLYKRDHGSSSSRPGTPDNEYAFAKDNPNLTVEIRAQWSTQFEADGLTKGDTESLKKAYEKHEGIKKIWLLDPNEDGNSYPRSVRFTAKHKNMCPNQVQSDVLLAFFTDWYHTLRREAAPTPVGENSGKPPRLPGNRD